MLIKQLLKCPSDKERMRGPVVNVATVELIYQLGKKQDSSYQDRYRQMCYNCFYNDCLISRALIGSFLSSIRVQTVKILIYASFHVQRSVVKLSTF